MKINSTPITTQNLTPTSTPTAGSAVSIANLVDEGVAVIDVLGTYTGDLTVRGRSNGRTYRTISAFTNVVTGASAVVIASGSEGTWRVNVSGFDAIEVTALGAMTGSAAVVIRATEAVASSSSSSGGGGSGDASAENQVAGNALLGAAGDAAPALATNASGIIGWLRYLASRWPAALGGTTASASIPVTLATDGQFVTSVGTKSTASAAPAGGTGMIAWLSDACYRIGLMALQLPASLGAKTGAGSLSVVLATNVLVRVIQCQVTTTGESFDLGAARTFNYNVDGTLNYEQIADGTITARKTYTYVSGQMTAESGWVKQ